MSVGRHVVVGTAGHIDHGKSTLVTALTGVDPDRWAEEKRRGITIDLGFAHLDHADRTFSFVDVPGHERFVHNMLAGATGVDLVLLVIAGDESVMPQTREHLAICDLLGLKAGVIAITRVDLCEPDYLELVEQEVRETVDGTFLENAPMVQVSGLTKQGIPELLDALDQAAGSLEEAAADGWPRLPVDRVFAVRGFGTVVTGTLQQGPMSSTHKLAAHPGGPAVRVRSIEIHGQTVESAPPRHRVAVNLQGIEREQLERGMVLAPEKAQITTSVADVMLRVLQSSPVPLEDGQRVRVHHGTMERLARLRLPQRAPMEPGKRQAAQIRFEQPIAALVGDRFIVRRYSPVATLAGGVIADLQPPRWRRDDERWPTRAQALADGNSSERIRLLVREAGVDGLLLAERSWQLGFDPESADRIATQLGAMRVFGASRWVGDDALAALEQAIESELSHYHAAEPLGRGLSVEILRARVAGNWDNESFRGLVNHFEQQNVLRLEAGFVIQASHQSSLGADEELALSRAIERLDQLGLDASDAAVLGEVTGLDGGALESVLQFASRQGRLVQLTDKRWLSAGVWSQIVETLRRECGERGDLIDVSTFKSLFEISRRNAIPLLETLDEQRVTRRVGNARKLILDEPSG